MFTKRKRSYYENVHNMKTFVMRKRSQYENVHKTKAFIKRKRSQDENVPKMKTFVIENVHKTSHENNTRCHKVGFKFRLKWRDTHLSWVPLTYQGYINSKDVWYDMLCPIG